MTQIVNGHPVATPPQLLELTASKSDWTRYLIVDSIRLSRPAGERDLYATWSITEPHASHWRFDGQGFASYAVPASTAVGLGVVDASVVHGLATAITADQLDEEREQVAHAQQQSADMVVEDIVHHASGYYDDTVTSIIDAPAALGRGLSRGVGSLWSGLSPTAKIAIGVIAAAALAPYIRRW